MQRELILYIAMSLDGYIATKTNDIGFLETVSQDGEDYGYNEFVSNIDTVIMGRKTYSKVLAMGHTPHPDKETYIVSRTPQKTIGNTKFYNGNLSELVKELKQQQGKNIYCDGGAEIVTLLLKDNLIDQLYLSVIPVFLGDGIRLFQDGRPQAQWHMVSAKQFPKGLVQLHYTLKK